jgi:predicted amidophosphoribosyltransferase
LCEDITICVVPSHKAGNENTSGISILAQRLAASGRINGVNYLIRTKDVDKKALGGSRKRDVDENTIEVNNNAKVTGSVILLVDDVTTSGNSLKVCKDKLLESGAERVAMFAIGQSI